MSSSCAVRTAPPPVATGDDSRAQSEAAAGIVLCLSGDLSGDRALDWEDLVHRIWANHSHPVTLDLSAVTLLTCQAVRAIVRVAARGRQLGIVLDLRRVPQQSARLLHWAHLDHLINTYLAESIAPELHCTRASEPVSDGPRSWAGLPRTATTQHGTISADQLETALLRTAIGDRRLERALTALAGAGPALVGLLNAGLITLEPDVDALGGGWWAEVHWADLVDAVSRGTVGATTSQAERVRDAALASGRLPGARTRG